jgi:hypothetical protein
MIDKNEDSTVFRRTSDSSNERHPRS